jgi:hypothetical protein
MHLHPTPAKALNELGHQPALAQPGVSDDPDHVPIPALRVRERVVQLPQLAIPTDKPRQTPAPGDIDMPTRGTQTDELVDLDQPRAALDLAESEFAQGEIALG